MDHVNLLQEDESRIRWNTNTTPGELQLNSTQLNSDSSPNQTPTSGTDSCPLREATAYASWSCCGSHRICGGPPLGVPVIRCMCHRANHFCLKMSLQPGALARVNACELRTGKIITFFLPDFFQTGVHTFLYSSGPRSF